MSDASAKAKKTTKKPAEHPKYTDMIKAAITALADRKGSSRQAIMKYVQVNYKVGDNVASHMKVALKRGVNSGCFVQVKGVGASGSFKLNKVEEKKKTKPKKPAAKKQPKKTPVKKTAAKKKTTAKKAGDKKKSPAKKKTAEKKKPKKPAAKKSPKKPAKKSSKTPAKKAKPAKKPAKKTPKKSAKK